jgi:hypothetical protein
MVAVIHHGVARTVVARSGTRETLVRMAKDRGPRRG